MTGFNSLVVQFREIQSKRYYHCRWVSIPWWYNSEKKNPMALKNHIKFQFLGGTIQSWFKSLEAVLRSCFNSLVVQFRGCACCHDHFSKLVSIPWWYNSENNPNHASLIRELVSIPWWYNSESINDVVNSLLSSFQFLGGTIQREWLVHSGDPIKSFNSLVVQFREWVQSTSVRIKVFQFLGGTIQSVCCTISCLVRHLFQFLGGTIQSFLIQQESGSCRCFNSLVVQFREHWSHRWWW